MVDKKELFLRQKELLDIFLGNGALTKKEYDKSYGDMVRLMGMEEAAAELADKGAAAKDGAHNNKTGGT